MIISEKEQYAIDSLKDEYLNCHKGSPWVIAFSGGKDSTAMLQLLWIALREILKAGIKLSRKIIIASNDTMVENPIISTLLHSALAGIEKAAKEECFPIECHVTTPHLEDRFWVKVIGKGYPIPTNSFRWCTDKLKIFPTSKLIRSILGGHSEAILLIGVRISESKSRAKSIKKHSSRGKRLSKHPTHLGIKVFSPIVHLSDENVWRIIRTFPAPWGTNEKLFEIYSDANADDYECPTFITSKNHKSCGQSRFGCWVCSLVKTDKSMQSLVNNGHPELAPLLQFRNDLVAERSLAQFRLPERRNGKPAVNGMGPLTIQYRASLLKRLYELQRKTGLPLIQTQEVIAIGAIWMREWFDFKTMKEVQTWNDEQEKKKVEEDRN